MKSFLSLKLSQNRLSLLLAFYVGLILNCVTYWRNAQTGHSLDAYLVGLAAVGIFAFVYLFLSLFAFFGERIYKTIASLLVFFSACASYYMIFFNVVIGYGIIISVLTTDTDLSKESLGYKFILWLIVTGIVPVIAIINTRFTHSAYRSPKPFKSVLVLVISILAGYGVTKTSFDYIEAVREKMAVQDNTYIPSPSGMLAHTYIPSNWIAALGLFAYEKMADEETNAKLFNPFEHFSYEATSPMDDVFVIIVVGETTRGDHLGILGYPRDTTPLLGKEPNLAYFKGVSCDTTTKLSLKCMYTRSGGTDDNEARTQKETNVFSLLKDLGFSSELFAMQSEMWFYKGAHPDSYKFREILAVENQNSNKPIDDMLLVNELRQSVASHQKGKHLVILHTKGSHYLYSERYPKEFAKFTPECKSIDDSCSAQTMINAFDNSVLFIDFMLKNVIDQVRDKKALVIYASDHGESISDDTHFHASPRKVAPLEQFRIPVLFWASDSFISSTPQRSANFVRLKALQASGAIIYHEVLFDSILGCLGFASPNGGINEKHNICSPLYEPIAYPYPTKNPYSVE